MRHQNIVVFGGSGYIGAHVIAQLVSRGRRVTVVTRRQNRAHSLILLPTVDVVEADPYDPVALERVLTGKDAVVNLVGALHSDRGEPYGRAFAQAHVALPQALVKACRQTGVTRFLHMSALGAASDAQSMYLRSKADGERVVREASGLDVTVFRPSVVFGEQDHFLNLFARLQKLFPVVPLACSEARFQPVYVGDVAHAMVEALDTLQTDGRIYELAGPRIYTLRELVRIAGLAVGHPRLILPLPPALGRLQAFVMELLPGPTLLSRDNLDSMAADNIATGLLPGLDSPELQGPTGWLITPVEQVAVEHLGIGDARTHFNLLRARAHR